MKKTILAAFCLMGAIACSNELEYQNDSRTVLTLELPGTTKTVLGSWGKPCVLSIDFL